MNLYQIETEMADLNRRWHELARLIIEAKVQFEDLLHDGEPIATQLALIKSYQGEANRLYQRFRALGKQHKRLLAQTEWQVLADQTAAVAEVERMLNCG